MKETEKNIQKFQVKDTPFVGVINIETNTYSLLIGNYLATSQTFTNRKELETYVNSKPWELLFNCMGIMAEHVFKQTEQKNISKTTDKNGTKEIQQG